LLLNQNSYELKAFLTIAEMFDFRFVQHCFFHYRIVQLAIVDVFGLHVLTPFLGWKHDNKPGDWCLDEE
jgi:hypothetical protein